MAPGPPPAAAMPTGEQHFAVTLKPVSHPELGEIAIDESLFAIGRGEAPFVTYAPEAVRDLSRRHARIFSEYGAVYLADLGSKNGTTLNRVDVRQQIVKLRDGDEICFGKSLTYRVQLRPAAAAPRAPKLAGLTLKPERADLGLQPIVVTSFPFLISKNDDAFTRYKDEFPHQVNYLSRRHAHIFLKGGLPYVEDLGSTNGTFVGGERLQERAVPLEEGTLLAFGGHHFVYRVSLQKEETAAPPSDYTVTRLSAPPAAGAAADADKTTFVAVAGSFLDIFCIEPPKAQEAEPAPEPQPGRPAAGRKAAQKRGRSLALARELLASFRGGDDAQSRRARGWSALLIALLAVGAFLAYLNGAPERELKQLLADHQYRQAAAVASASLARDPDDRELKILGTEALLKDGLPRWIGYMKSRDYGRAGAELNAMKQLAARNTEAQPLLAELEWVGRLEQFVAGRGGPDAAVRDAAEEEAIRRIQRQWEEDEPIHQRAFATISAYVPEFKDTYASALSDLRKLALVAAQSK